MLKKVLSPTKGVKTDKPRDSVHGPGCGPIVTRRVALTFDMEHPSRSRHDPDGPRQILDALRRTDSRATFFIQGRWARTQPALARRVADEEHLVGCHGHFHAPLVSLTDDGIRNDLEAATEAIVETTGVMPRPWFRCPFGSGHDDSRVLRVIDECGYKNVHWNVEPEDWLEGRTSEEVTSSIVRDIESLEDDAVVLLHTWPTATVQAVPSLLDYLIASGKEMVRVDELQL
jgi:peptidoglycan/xylan/chitin deacetylase (PgdA/CDA1 family)